LALQEQTKHKKEIAMDDEYFDARSETDSIQLFQKKQVLNKYHEHKNWQSTMERSKMPGE
jgi:hypothetical protein